MSNVLNLRNNLKNKVELSCEPYFQVDELIKNSIKPEKIITQLNIY